MITKKKKVCYGCNKEQFIWGNKDGHKYCIKCWNSLKYPDTDSLVTPVANPTPSVKKVKKFYKINPISKSRQEALKTYRSRRDEYFQEHPICEFPGCSSKEIDLHHKKGRTGSFLTDKRYFCSLCRAHHIWVENHPQEAQKMGLSLKRLDKE